MPKAASHNAVPGYDAPAGGAAAVTPSDGSDLTVSPCRALFVGGAGDVYVDTLQGDTNVLFTVPAGFILPLMVTRVRSTSTTATNIVALY